MKNTALCMTAVVSLLLSAGASADIYQWKDASGHVVFSDKVSRITEAKQFGLHKIKLKITPSYSSGQSGKTIKLETFQRVDEFCLDKASLSSSS